jgi:hypothetical protein
MSLYSFRLLLLGLCVATLSACMEWNADESALTARTAPPQAGPDCASCHAYPLTDRNHKFHLIEEGSGNRDLNGKITCLDCHSKAIQFQAVTLFDTLFEDTVTGEVGGTLDHPNPLDTNSEGRVIRTLSLVRVDTLNQHHPLLMPPRPGTPAKFQEYVTSLAHLNDRVDVDFDIRNSDTARFHGQFASYNPTQESCSAVACHPLPDKPFSFGSIAKGLPELPVPEGQNP